MKKRQTKSSNTILGKWYPTQHKHQIINQMTEFFGCKHYHAKEHAPNKKQRNLFFKKAENNKNPDENTSRKPNWSRELRIHSQVKKNQIQYLSGEVRLEQEQQQRQTTRETERDPIQTKILKLEAVKKRNRRDERTKKSEGAKECEGDFFAQKKQKFVTLSAKQNVGPVPLP